MSEKLVAGRAFELGFNGVARAGQVWETNGRKGPLTLKLLQDIDTSKDSFFKAEIVDGKASFASDSYRLAQRLDGLGTAGTAMSFRTTLCHFHKYLGKSTALPQEGKQS